MLSFASFFLCISFSYCWANFYSFSFFSSAIALSHSSWAFLSASSFCLSASNGLWNLEFNYSKFFKSLEKVLASGVGSGTKLFSGTLFLVSTLIGSGFGVSSSSDFSAWIAYFFCCCYFLFLIASRVLLTAISFYTADMLCGAGC